MRCSAALAAFAFFASVSAQTSQYNIESRPIGPGVSTYITNSGPPTAVLDILVNAQSFVLGNGALYDMNWDALGIPLTTGNVLNQLPNTASTVKYQNFTVATNTRQLTFVNNGYTFYQCGTVTPYNLEVSVPGGGIPVGPAPCNQVNLFLSPVGIAPIPPPPVTSSYIVVSGSSNTALNGLALAENPLTQQINVNGTNPTLFFHDGIAQTIYDNLLRVWITHGTVAGGAPLSFGPAVIAVADQNFVYTGGVVSYTDRGTALSQSFLICQNGPTFILQSAPNGSIGPNCVNANLVSVDPASYVPPVSSSSVVASTSSVQSSASSSTVVVSSSAVHSSSVASPTTTNTATGTMTNTAIVTMTHTATGTNISTVASGTATTVNSTPTPGTPQFIIVVDHSSNPALKNMRLSLSGSGSSGIIFLITGDGSPAQFVNGFLRFLGGFFAIIDDASSNPFGAPVDFNVDINSNFGLNHNWASLLSLKRQTGSSLSFVSPSGAPAFFFACQVGGASGSFVLYSSYSTAVPVGCSVVTLSVQTNNGPPPTPGSPSNGVTTVTNDICVNVAAVQICTSGVFTTNGSGNLTVSNNIDINLGTTFLVCAANSTNCQAVTQLPVTNLPSFAVTCTCSICCSIVPLNAAGFANTGAIAAAQSCGCLAGSALASAAASAQASAAATAAASGNAGSSGSAAAAAAAGNGGSSSAAAAAAAAGNGASSSGSSAAAAAAAGNAGSSPGSSASTKNSNAVFTGAAVSKIIDFISTLLVSVGTMMVLA